MICPACSGETVVLSTRDRKGYTSRRHACTCCRARFTSHQHILWVGSIRAPTHRPPATAAPASVARPGRRVRSPTGI